MESHSAAPEQHPAAPEQTDGFRDPTRLAKWTRGFLCASIASALLRAGSDASSLLGGGGLEESADTGLRVIFWILTEPIWLITAVLVLTWIHRANHNARQLGAADMRFTPGWAVGWYFVPIAWFWKPYQVMSEIWRASRHPSYWRGQPVSALLPWWWALWILPFWGSSVVDLTVGRNLDEAGAETLEAASELAYWILEIPLILVLLGIIGGVHRMQTEHHRRQAAAR